VSHHKWPEGLVNQDSGLGLGGGMLHVRVQGHLAHKKTPTRELVHRPASCCLNQHARFVLLERSHHRLDDLFLHHSHPSDALFHHPANRQTPLLLHCGVHHEQLYRVDFTRCHTLKSHLRAHTLGSYLMKRKRTLLDDLRARGIQLHVKRVQVCVCRGSSPIQSAPL